MDPMLASALGAFVRWGLNLLVPFLVANGIWTPEESTAYVTGATLSILSFVWIMWTKYKDRISFLRALDAPQGTPEADVKFRPTPMLFVLLALGSATLTGACASGGALAPTVANYGAQLTNIAVQAQDVVLQADKSGLQPNKDLTAKSQVKFRELGVVLQKLATGLRAYDALSDAQKAESAGQLRELMIEARKLTRAVMAFTGGNETLGNQLLDLFSNLDRLFDEVAKGLNPA